ncbi:MAG: hypothetical protein M1828_003996 [Chrysothrix sp. TS-e1954]|nr:MAG: hypothetical protein M1828_003996 [Chrysothrix sp. TS-e1954]
MQGETKIPDASGRGTRQCIANDGEDLATFERICFQKADPIHYPLSSSIVRNVPIYDAAALECSGLWACEERIQSLKDELYNLLQTGPGVFVLKHMYQHMEVIDETNECFQTIIDHESRGGQRGDHFSAGKNDRIWNSFGKHCIADPDAFVEYYSNPWLALVCDSWLGPGYRVTAQTNIVKPGGAAQVPHRDYHLGFQGDKILMQYPIATQRASQFLTLQGAIAHSDMPEESGPTRFLPFSQTYDKGYSAVRLDAFKKVFEEHWVSLPLEKGDGVFFSPALFHAAGENLTQQLQRSANLLQISSAFGKPMETIDTVPLVECCWDLVLSMHAERPEGLEAKALIAALGEGYPFPTNLDLRPPGPDGMAPKSEQDLLHQALSERWATEMVVERMKQIKHDSAMSL